MFDFDFSEESRRELKSLSKKDKALANALSKKIKEICSRDSQTIEYYKNLRKPLNEFKRVHVGSFVLIFKVFKEKKLVYFDSFKHHDEAYKP